MSQPATAQATPTVFRLGDRGRAVSEIRARLALLGLTDAGPAGDGDSTDSGDGGVARGGRTLVQALQPSWITLADGPGAANDPED